MSNNPNSIVQDLTETDEHRLCGANLDAELQAQCLMTASYLAERGFNPVGIIQVMAECCQFNLEEMISGGLSLLAQAASAFPADKKTEGYQLLWKEITANFGPNGPSESLAAMMAKRDEVLAAVEAGRRGSRPLQ